MGMPDIRFRLRLFRGDFDQARSQLALLWLMEALTRINQSLLRQSRTLVERGIVKESIPRVYRSGVHYEREPPGQEVWPDCISILESKGENTIGKYPGPSADCEDLACWRTAELRELGNISAKPFAKWRLGKEGNYHYHALVLLPDGRLEDPSLTLGMGREQWFHDNKVVDLYKSSAAKPLVMFAKRPEVMIVDPEKPTGYSGGQADRMNLLYGRGLLAGGPFDASDLAAWGYDRSDVSAADARALRELMSGQVGSISQMIKLPEISTSDLLAGREELDRQIGWTGKDFVRDSNSELQRLLGWRNV